MIIDWSKAPEWAAEVGASTSGFAWMGNGNCMFFSTNVRRDLDDVLTRLRFWTIERRQAEWSGEGLPAVGADVECTFAVEDHSVWHRGTVVHRALQPEGGEFVVVDTGTISACYRGDGTCLRPYRTAEQIAAENRIAEINQMLGHIRDWPSGSHGVNHYSQLKIHEDACCDLYDAGYRKQEAAQ